jgi:hypothetical protein
MNKSYSWGRQSGATMGQSLFQKDYQNIQKEQHSDHAIIIRFQQVHIICSQAEGREITCFDAHIIPDYESLVLAGNNDDNLSEAEEENRNQNATTPTDTETLVENNMSHMTEPSEPHLIEISEEFKAGFLPTMSR